MASKGKFADIRKYFTQKEWKGLSQFMKSRYANIKENYELMVKLKLEPPLPEFMKPRPAPAKPAELPTKSNSPSAETSSSGSRYPRRQRKKVNYRECEGNSDEEYLFEENSDEDYLSCDDCGIAYPGDCPKHGPLTHVKDVEVDDGDPLRANKTVPEGLSIRRSTIKGAQYGVFTLKPLPKRVYFGPYEGVKMEDNGERNGYIWEVRKDGKMFLIDGRPLDRSNWMRYVNCAASPQEANLVAFTRYGNIYYRTRNAVGAGEELFLWYGEAFARELGLLGKPRGSGPSAREDRDSTARPQPVFSCDTCGELFSAQDQLEKHRRRKHLQRPEGRHRCAHCPYSSYYKSHVTRHEQTHTGERPFVCHVCHKSFTLRSDLNRHQLVHSGERPHECPECGQRFCQAFKLTTHRRVQHGVDGGVASHLCPHCGKGFTRNSSLKRHLKKHTGGRPHACSHCGKKFTERCNAVRHERVVHGRQYRLHCPHCGKGLADIGVMRAHVRKCDSSAGDNVELCSDE